MTGDGSQEILVEGEGRTAKHRGSLLGLSHP
jgi:hypothetical protein